jgi:ABC-type nitrate/sulfonate/bicarbonate transport system permease component
MAGISGLCAALPLVVWDKLLQVIANGSLLRHMAVTLREVVLGLLLGVSAGLLLGYLLGKNRTVESLIAPYLVASQSVRLLPSLRCS